jgi:hypothetical protein
MADKRLVASLSTGDVQALLAGCTGKVWLNILDAVRDNEVDGQSLSEQMESPASLAEFFREDLDCVMTTFVAKQFHQKLLAAGGVRGPPPPPPAPADAVAKKLTGTMVPLRVQFSRAGGEEANMKITVEVPVAATPSIARRCLMDRLGLPLSATLVLSHAGRPLQDTNAAGGPIVDWASLSVVHAVQLPTDTPLTLSNADTHAAVAASVVLDSGAGGGADGGGRGAGGGAEDAGGWRLAVRDEGEPLGNGAFGAVFPGTAFFARREVPVAVKKFFMLENPRLYGLMNAPAVASVVQRDLLPEVNTLLSLAHRNVVRLRCVGLGRVYGAPVPAYVAMDFCSEGTLEQWIEQQRLTNVVLVAFLGDLVDAMVYVRSRGRLHGRRALLCWFRLPMHSEAVLASMRA